MYEVGIVELGRALSAMCPLGIRELGKGIWYEAWYAKGYQHWTRKLFGRSAPIALLWGEQIGRVMTMPQDASRRLIAAIASKHGLTAGDLTGPNRRRHVVVARYEAIKAVKAAHPQLSYPQLGRLFNRDHSTCLYAMGGLARKPSFYTDPNQSPAVAAE